MVMLSQVFGAIVVFDSLNQMPPFKPPLKTWLFRILFNESYIQIRGERVRNVELNFVKMNKLMVFRLFGLFKTFFVKHISGDGYPEYLCRFTLN